MEKNQKHFLFLEIIMKKREIIEATKIVWEPIVESCYTSILDDPLNESSLEEEVYRTFEDYYGETIEIDEIKQAVDELIVQYQDLLSNS